MKTSQCKRILALLESYKGGWCPLPKILKLQISQYGTRILEMRRTGTIIENKTEWINGEKHSWFRYVPKIKEEMC